MTRTALLCSFLGACLLSGMAAAQGPDITTLKIGQEANDFHYYGQSGGIAAYSMGTTSCNPGTVPVEWTNQDHPVIGQNIFRLKDGRFEQIGQSWLKHGFCAVNEGGCGSCQQTNCDTLGIGCADTYWATLNDGAGGGPKYLVNATTGLHSHPYPSPSGPSAIRGRLQVLVSDIDPAQNPGAVYFAEAQYVSAHDAGAGNAWNNNAYRRLNVVSVSDINGGGPTNVTAPAVLAWREVDPLVMVATVTNTDEGGSGMPGIFNVGSKVTNHNNVAWTYDYVVHNLTSTQSAGSFTIPIPAGMNVTNTYFHDIPYHSGEPYSGTDWAWNQQSGIVSWSTTQTHQQNPNANAIRWGTMYTFSFTCDSAPQTVTGEIGLFAPGSGSVLTFNMIGPGGIPPVGSPYCAGDGSGTFCPCLNFGLTDRGCENGSYWQGCKLDGDGTASVSSDTVVLTADRGAKNQPGLFFQGDQEVNAGRGVIFGDGLRCAGGTTVRLEIVTTDAVGDAETTIDIGAAGGVSGGDVRYYQFWFRDPVESPCGGGFNTSNGYRVVWAP